MQILVFASALAITALSALLSLTLLASYKNKRRASTLFWGAGLALFAFGTLLEALFAAGIYTVFLAKLYLFVVAALVALLALGSVQLVRSRHVKNAYYAFTAVSLAFVAYSLCVSGVGDILVNYVVYAPLPSLVVIASSIATFPAAIAIIVVAALSYRRTRSRKMLSIIAGVVIVSIAGTLYIAQFPAALYYAEAVGIALLWAGFYSRK